MSNIVSFRIQIEGSNEFKTVTFSADELGKALDAVRGSTKSLKGELVNLGAVSQILESVSSAVMQLNSMMVSLTSSYAAQVEAETQLATAMRNTMDATDEEIDRIKQLASEQQRLGIVGDEVQLAAAQELATYLSLSSSLEAIIPTMNDMIAQQLGMGASAESATQIATMLGKVMNGQTKALSRYGYEFSAAQEHILLFGDESERAAVLCQVVGEAVGGMNEALAQTDVGRQQQLANTLGDIRETLGGIVQRAQPVVTAIAEIGHGAIGIRQLAVGIRALGQTQLIAAGHARMQAAAQRILAAAGYSAAAGTTALRVAVVALYGALTMGLSVAIQAVISLVTRLASKSKEAAGAIDDAKDAQQAYADASMNVRMSLAEETIRLESLIKSKKDASKAVADLNSRYGAVFGSHKTAAEWYDVLTQKSAAYAKQVGYEAQAKVIASQKAAKELEKIDKENRMRELADKAADPVKNYGNTYYRSSVYKADATEWRKLKAEVAALDGEIAGLQGSFDSCTQAMADAAREIGDVTAVTGGVGKETKTLADDVADYRKSVERAVEVHQVFGGSVQDVDVRIKAMQSGITSLINKYGAENAAVKGLIGEYARLKRSREESVPALTPVSPLPSLKENLKAEAPSIIARPGHRATEQDLAFRKYNEIRMQLPGADPSKQRILQQQLETLRELYDIPEEGVSSLDASVDAFGALASAMGSLSGIVGEGASAWLSWSANVLRAVSQALPALSTLFAAQSATAQAGGAAAVASTPVLGPVKAVAAVASIAAALASIPRFAAGGLIYGPTIGLMGEYANARTNPEFIGKVSDIQRYIQPAAGPSRIVGKLSGRDIILLEQRMGRFDARNNG